MKNVDSVESRLTRVDLSGLRIVRATASKKVRAHEARRAR